jgi:hypothetical protein
MKTSSTTIAGRTIRALGLIASLALAASASQAATFFLVPVTAYTGSTTTTPFGINDSNTLVGSYVDAGGAEHGFTGPLSTGVYTSFDVGTGGTQPRGINNNGIIVGVSNSQGATKNCQLVEWERTSTKTALITKAGTGLGGVVQGVDPAGNFYGDYRVCGVSITAYEGKAFKWTADLGVSQSFARGANGKGTIVGYFNDTAGTHGVIQSGGVNTKFDFPGIAGSTFLEGINNNGLASGLWFDAAGNPHGFLLDTNTGIITVIPVPGATQVQAWGINSSGLVTVSSDVGPYVFCSALKNCPTSASGAIRIHTSEMRVDMTRLPHVNLAQLRRGTVSADVEAEPVRAAGFAQP